MVTLITPLQFGQTTLISSCKSTLTSCPCCRTVFFTFFKINISQRKYFSITVIQMFQHKKTPWGSQKYRQKTQCKIYNTSWFCTGAAFTFDKPLLQQSFVSEFLLLHTYIFLSFPIPHWIYQRILYYPSMRSKLSDPSGTEVSWNYFYTIESLPPKYYTISQHTSLNQFLLSVANRKPAGIACRLKFTMEFNELFFPTCAYLLLSCSPPHLDLFHSLIHSFCCTVNGLTKVFISFLPSLQVLLYYNVYLRFPSLCSYTFFCLLFHHFFESHIAISPLFHLNFSYQM